MRLHGILAGQTDWLTGFLRSQNLVLALDAGAAVQLLGSLLEKAVSEPPTQFGTAWDLDFAMRSQVMQVASHCVQRAALEDAAAHMDHRQCAWLQPGAAALAIAPIARFLDNTTPAQMRGPSAALEDCSAPNGHQRAAALDAEALAASCNVLRFLALRGPLPPAFSDWLDQLCLRHVEPLPGAAPARLCALIALLSARCDAVSDALAGGEAAACGPGAPAALGIALVATCLAHLRALLSRVTAAPPLCRGTRTTDPQRRLPGSWR